ncbi:unnamed protein product, partial [Staurois parvus]
MSLTLVVSGKNVPYIGCQWEECPLHWWSGGRMPLTLVVSGKNVPYVGGQWEECPLHWRSVRRMSLTLEVSGKGDQSAIKITGVMLLTLQSGEGPGPTKPPSDR